MEKKTLVAYFSASGVTAKLAKALAEITGADLYEIQPAQLYTSADLDWTNKKSRSSTEMNNPDSRPAISSKVENMNQYETVFVGFPIWWYVAPTIINTFLESYDFSGKAVIPFATSGGSGMGKTDSILKKCCSPITKWKSGKRFGGADKAVLKSWVDSLGL
ncbi:flavodoxin [Faecalicatena contorta]|uniref:Flavodoxin n=1 Tax=Faecalicatena contorta TaxID=39482 RepID=A0A315ZRZ6_9FIRM|nr:flavodoxin [Faecalicatena contorta]PWJ47903.1 flavodoxin-like protein [Faecalicatena contorta]SUQ15666.1 Flavodoxin [Faecalicatena contorta]